VSQGGWVWHSRLVAETCSRDFSLGFIPSFIILDLSLRFLRLCSEPSAIPPASPPTRAHLKSNWLILAFLAARPCVQLTFARVKADGFSEMADKKILSLRAPRHAGRSNPAFEAHPSGCGNCSLPFRVGNVFTLQCALLYLSGNNFPVFQLASE